MTRVPRLFLFALALLAVGLVCVAVEAAGERGGARGMFGGGMFGRGGFGGGLNLGMVASNAQAQEKLALTDAQKEAVAAAVKASAGERGRGGFPEGFREMSEEEQGKVLKDMEAARQKRQDALAKALKEALGEEKLAKLELLAAGVALQPGPRALSDAAVAKAVGVSEASQKKVAEIVEASGKEMMAAFQELRDSGGDREAMQAKMKELQTGLNKKISGALTEEEREKVKAAVAAAADIKMEFGRGGRRGRGGGEGAPKPEA